MKALILFLFIPLLACGQKYVDPGFNCVLDSSINSPLNQLTVDTGTYYLKAGCTIEIDTLRGIDFKLAKYGEGANPILKVKYIIGSSIELTDIDFIDTTRSGVNISGVGNLQILRCNFVSKYKGIKISGYKNAWLHAVDIISHDTGIHVTNVDNLIIGNLRTIGNIKSASLVTLNVKYVDIFGSSYDLNAERELLDSIYYNGLTEAIKSEIKQLLRIK